MSNNRLRREEERLAAGTGLKLAQSNVWSLTHLGRFWCLYRPSDLATPFLGKKKAQRAERS